MPEIVSKEIGIALDMRGCPNRCRHCYLACPPNGNLTEDDLRWAAAQFKGFVKEGQDRPFVENLHVSSWMREPDFSDDYRHLADVEAELGNGEPNRYELLSIWRLARDPGYAEWAKSVGPDTCQITFFGLRETQDWFYRRPGAFDDCIRATERLLEVGMKPRWQFFLTKKILPDLDGLMSLIDKMRIRERVAALGGEFVMFIHAPCLFGEGIGIADLSATLDDTRLIPAELVESTKKHFGTDKLWKTEAEFVSRVLTDPEGFGCAYEYPQPVLWFFVLGDWDVFSNMGSTAPWWKLGNLKADSVGAIIDRFEADAIPALHANRTVGIDELARRYGDPGSQRLIDDAYYWLEKYCRDNPGK